MSVLTNEDDSKGEKIVVKAHGGPIDIEGITVAKVNDRVQLQKVETWFDPLEMFRQIAPKGMVGKEVEGTEGTELSSERVEVLEGEEEKHEEMSHISTRECPFMNAAEY